MIGRPEKTEAAEFYWTYIDKARGEDAVALLERQIGEYEAVLSGLSEEQSLYRYAPEKWSIRQVVNHVTDTERAFAFRALWFARGFAEALPGLDQDVAAAGAGADAVSLARHLEEFRQVRLGTISLFKNLPEAAWMRRGTAGGKVFTVRVLAFIAVGHAEHHLGVLRERYLG
jgi:uncharacterized damage-inducible protein DinB